MRYLAMLLLLFTSLIAHGEIERNLKTEDGEVQYYWWPKLTLADGWVQDITHSYHFHANAIVPEGEVFPGAETVVYAKAIYKPMLPNVSTLEAFIGRDKASYLADIPGVVIHPADSVKTAEGKTLTSYRYEPTQEGNHERLVYGEDDKFYLVFALSSRSKEGLAQAMDDFVTMVESYRHQVEQAD